MERKQLANNTLVIAIGRGVGILVSLALLPLYTTFLSPAEYGVVDLITTYVLLLAPAVILQIDMGVFRYLIDARGDKWATSSAVTASLSVMIASIIVLGIAAVTASYFVSIPLFWYAFISLVASVVVSVLTQIARGLGKNNQFVISGIITSLMTLGLSVLFVAVFKMGVPGVLTANILASILCVMYLSVTTRIYSNLHRPDVKDLQTAKDMILYAAPLIPNGAAWWAVNTSNRTIIALMVDVSANGIYAAASRFPALLITIFGVVNTSWTESASLHINSKGRDSFFSDTLNASLKLYVSLALCLIALMPIVFPILIDRSFHEALRYIPIITIGTIFSAMAAMYSGIYIAKKMTKQIMYTSLAAAALNMGLALLLIPYISIYGAVVASSVSFALMAVYRHMDVSRYIKIKYETNMLLTLTFAIALTLTIYYSNVSLWIEAIYSVIIILMSLYLNKDIALYVCRKLLKR